MMLLMTIFAMLLGLIGALPGHAQSGDDGYEVAGGSYRARPPTGWAGSTALPLLVLALVMAAAPLSDVAVPTTKAPCLANSAAIAAPMPREAPVTRATCPTNAVEGVGVACVITQSKKEGTDHGVWQVICVRRIQTNVYVAPVRPP